MHVLLTVALLLAGVETHAEWGLGAPFLPPPGPDGCPPWGGAYCPGQHSEEFPYSECGGRPRRNLAYGLRVGHYDIDCNTNMIYNASPGSSEVPPDIAKWKWYKAPALEPDNFEEWCTHTTEDTEDYGGDWMKANVSRAPPARPWCPKMVRCIDGSDGGMNCENYPSCRKFCGCKVKLAKAAPLKPKSVDAVPPAWLVQEQLDFLYNRHPALFSPRDIQQLLSPGRFDGEYRARLMDCGYSAQSVDRLFASGAVRQGSRLVLKPKVREGTGINESGVKK